MELTKEFKQEIAPFFWMELEYGAAVCLDTGTYLQEVFDTRIDEGFEGNGYDWGSLAQVFLEKHYPDLLEEIELDPEGGMFYASSENKDALADFIIRFKKACEDKPFILDLFSLAEID